MRKLLTIASVVGFMGMLGMGTIQAQGAQDEAPHAGVPQWIRDEKVRSSYFHQWASEDMPGKFAEAGFNTMLIQFCNRADHFAKWARLARENDLHFFAALWFDHVAYTEAIHGPGSAGPKALSTYRGFVHRDTGPHTVILCPADEQYWADWIMPLYLEMARLSLEHAGADGIIMDAELYGPLTTRPAIPVSFYMDVGPCMCDDCFGDFLQQVGAEESLTDVPWADRYQWLVEHDLTRDYNIHLRDRVAALARNLREQTHAINPDLLLGFMNWYRNDIGGAPGENYFLHGWRDGLKTPEQPVIIWTESPEYSLGYGPHTDARYEFFQSAGDVIYIPGLYLEEHAPNKLSQQVHDLAMHSDGYWIFTRYYDLVLNPTILGRFKAGNDKIAADGFPRQALP